MAERGPSPAFTWVDEVVAFAADLDAAWAGVTEVLSATSFATEVLSATSFALADWPPLCPTHQLSKVRADADAPWLCPSCTLEPLTPTERAALELTR